MLVDTHCHLNFDRFDQDRDVVIERARAGKVARILNPGIDLDTSRQAIRLAEQYPEVYAAVGVHPNDVSTWDEHTLETLRDLASHPKTVAIGEIGLDDYWERTPRQTQESSFQMQLNLAAEMDLPVVVHIRTKTADDHRAMEDALAMLVEWQRGLQREGRSLAERPGVLHSFSDRIEYARRAIDANFYIGITGPVTFKNAEALQQVAAQAPLERLLIETDAPFLTPHPHRGERNEPGYVGFVAAKIAALRGMEPEEVEQNITDNAERLFLWQVIR